MGKCTNCLLEVYNSTLFSLKTACKWHSSREYISIEVLSGLFDSIKYMYMCVYNLSPSIQCLIDNLRYFNFKLIHTVYLYSSSLD